MTFSVIVPCYNCAATLETTVRSLCTSGLNDYEILLIDDGSIDGTAVCCDMLCVQHPQIRCLHQKNAGVSAARNRGIDEARGDYIWFVDADDTVDTLDMMQVQQAIEANTDCIMFGMEFLYTWHKRTVRHELLTCDNPLTLTSRNMGIHFRALFEKNYFSPIWNKLIRRSILTENALYFDPTLINYEDLHFSLTLMQYCKTVVVLSEIYYHYVNVFGHDRTVERVQKISDVIAYTDKITAPFYALEEQLCKSNSPQIAGLSEMVLHLYIEAAYFKLQTAGNSELKRLCTLVQKSCVIHRESHSIIRLSRADQRLYRWMMNDSYAAIWLFMHYRSLRSRAGRLYHIARCYSGDKA